MMQNQNHTTPAQPSRTKGILSTLFVPSVGSSIAPLRNQNRMFTQLVAMVFAIYGLFPLDHPFLKNQNEAPMSLMQVIATAYARVTFSRQTILQPIVFFAVLSVMVCGAMGVGIAVLAMFSTSAHASGFFDVTGNDLAISWLKYLFRGGSMTTGDIVFGDVTAYLEDPFTGFSAIQYGFVKALAFYSNAILLVAGILLFYFLVVLIAETAHHGEVMGKKANKIWAPIRLVFAIGLLVPINSGLNTGQYIVVRVAELGSALATNVWNVFIDSLLAANLSFTGPSPGILERIAMDLIRMKACSMAWDKVVTETGGSLKLDDAKIKTKTQNTSQGGVEGTRYSFGSNSLESVDICGAYFIPSGEGALAQKAAAVQKSAIDTALNGDIKTAAQKIEKLTETEDNIKSDDEAELDGSMLKAVSSYQKAVTAGMVALSAEEAALYVAALTSLKTYGWALAGAFANTISRVQADLAIVSVDSMPRTERPKIQDVVLNGSGPGNDVYAKTVAAMNAFDVFSRRDAARGSSGTSAQCSMMAGLEMAEGDSVMAALGHKFFGMIDWAGTMSGVWTTKTGIACGMANGPTTFHLGVFFGGKDPLSQMTRLGHNLLKMAFISYAIAMTGEASKAGLAAAAEKGKDANGKKTKMGQVLGGLSALPAAFSGLGMFAGSVFMMTGFTLAFIVPLLPFLYFFFAVLTWVVAVMEAVVAVPLICLAQLNPEGDGLPGKARKAFFFIFNIFLRPTMTVFGLIIGMLVLYIALSYLNFAYMIAVAGAGGTAYGLATLAKIVYTAIYCIICFIIANHSFKIIDHIPANALNWMGESAQAMHAMGDVAKVEQMSLIMSSMATGTLAPMMQKGAGALGGGVGHLLGPSGGNYGAWNMGQQRGGSGALTQGQIPSKGVSPPPGGGQPQVGASTTQQGAGTRAQPGAGNSNQAIAAGGQPPPTPASPPGGGNAPSGGG